MRYGHSGFPCLKRRSPGDMRHGDNISLPDSVIETSKPVKLKDFAEHYRIMSADSGTALKFWIFRAILSAFFPHIFKFGSFRSIFYAIFSANIFVGNYFKANYEYLKFR
jgi:hypothetical protein